MVLGLGLNWIEMRVRGRGLLELRSEFGMLGLGLGAGKFIMSTLPHKGRSTRVCVCVVEPCGLLSSSLPQLDSDG